MKTIFRREWAMPDAETFSVPPIGEFVRNYLQPGKISVDPFARNKRWATHTNDINPKTEAEHHLEAREFLRMLVDQKVHADLVIFDPPYSPRQVSECYKEVGLTATMRDTQTAAMKRECRELIQKLCNPGSVVLSFGWNTVGMGKGWFLNECLLCCHGGDHNDTICIAETMLEKQMDLL